MNGHIHVSAVSLLELMFGLMIVLPILHVTAIYLANTPFGQALAFSL